jgi:hypothetical protein
MARQFTIDEIFFSRERKGLGGKKMWIPQE